MYYVTLDYDKKHLYEIIKRAKLEPNGVLIVEDNQSFILINKDELEAWTETAELLQDSDILSDIEAAREDYKAGECLTMEQVFDLNGE